MPKYVEKSLAPGEQILMQGRWPVVLWVWAWFLLLTLGIILVGVWLFVTRSVRMLTTEFAVTSQRVILKRGWLSRQTEELAVQSIEGVNLNQSIWERLWGYGTLVVTGTGDAEIRFPPMAHPVEFRRAIETSRAQARQDFPSNSGGAADNAPRRQRNGDRREREDGDRPEENYGGFADN